MGNELTSNGDGDIFSAFSNQVWAIPPEYGDIPARETALLRDQHPMWCDLFENCVLDTADMGQLEDLVHTAPTDYSCGVIYGVILMRVQIAFMTGRQLEWDPEAPMGTFGIGADEIMAPNYGARQAAEMLRLRKQHSDWYAFFEDCLVEVASRSEIEELLQAAPTAFASGIAYGVIVMRVYMGMLTGREFS